MDPELRRLKGWICGPCGPQNCPVGERLVGCCSHVATVIYIAAGIGHAPQWHSSTHLNSNLLQRGMPEMAEEVYGQWVN